ncbi:MAG: Maf family protein [Eubacterium sp.]
MLILASKSPRRKELLSLITEDFVIKSSNEDEALPKDITPKEAVEYLSKIKAHPFANGVDTVIGADTVVACDGKILGKPADRNEAFEMLRMLSGRVHSVFTGVTVIKPNSSVTFSVETRVEFFELSDSQIQQYIDTGECDDKAGAYAIQGKGALFVKGIEGDWANVVGLPVSTLNLYL